MPEGYGSQADYMARVSPQARARFVAVEKALRHAFSGAIRKEEIEVIVFSDIPPELIGESFLMYPAVLKPILAVCNVAARAVERDLAIKNLDTYNPRLTREQALLIARYIKPFLPPDVPLPTLSRLDLTEFIDKEIRKGKGQWEKRIRETLNSFARLKFAKRNFTYEGELYEIDAAAPEVGSIKFAVDIKRIEARRDIHKRSDEIANKADRFVRTFPRGEFGAVIYYPFPQEHANIQDRLRSQNITSVVFASESKESIEKAVRLLLAKFEATRGTQ